MENTFILAESGSTKTNWYWHKSSLEALEWTSAGINPYYQTPEQLQTQLLSALPFESRQTSNLSVYFYGAGCGQAHSCQKMRLAFEQVCSPDTQIWIESDMLAAARSLCGTEAGIVGILGTGSNSCLFDGQQIVEDGLGLGYVLGDEGAGAWLGKTLISDYFGQRMPADLAQLLRASYPLDRASVLENIYSKPYPNRFLASFAPFFSAHIDQIYCKQMIKYGFELFLDNCISQHTINQANHADLPIHFTGSVAAAFAIILKDLLASRDLKIGRIAADPFEALKHWHQINFI